MPDVKRGDGYRVTSYDVARQAGVSQSAVSRCFKPGASVSKKMRARVMKVADDLGYQPNAIARSLITHSETSRPIVFACTSVGGTTRDRIITMRLCR